MAVTLSVSSVLPVSRSRVSARRSTPELGASLTLLLAPLLLALLLPPSARVFADPTPAAEIEALRDRVFEDPTLQTDLPGWEALEGTRSSKSRDPGPRRGWWLPDLPASGALTSAGHLLQWALFAVGAVALVMGLIWLMRELLSHRRRAPSRQIAATDDPTERDPAAHTPAEGDLEALVHRGEYGAAIHVLLLKALARLSGRGRRIPAGRTSREVLSATADLTPPAHGALGELVAAVERYLFGGREPQREDFERCRRAFGVVERALAEAVAEPAAEETA